MFWSWALSLGSCRHGALIPIWHSSRGYMCVNLSCLGINFTSRGSSQGSGLTKKIWRWKVPGHEIMGAHALNILSFSEKKFVSFPSCPKSKVRQWRGHLSSQALGAVDLVYFICQMHLRFMSLEKVFVHVRDCEVRWDPWHAGIHGNPESGNDEALLHQWN